MDDSISRQAAIDALKLFGAEHNAIAVIKGLPSAETEIVRCKECEHWDTSWQNDYAPNYHYCPLVDGTRRDDFYCADAERRGEA